MAFLLNTGAVLNKIRTSNRKKKKRNFYQHETEEKKKFPLIPKKIDSWYNFATKWQYMQGEALLLALYFLDLPNWIPSYLSVWERKKSAEDFCPVKILIFPILENASNMRSRW